MIRMPFAVACALLVAGSAFAQTAAPAGASSSAPAVLDQGQTTPPVQAPKPPALPTGTTPAPPIPPPVPFATDSKVGFVNMQAVVVSTELGKKSGVTLKAFQDKKSGELTAKGKQISDLQKEIDAGRTTLPQSVLQTKGIELTRLQREMDAIQQNADDEFKALNDQLLTGFSEKTMPIVEALAKEKGLYLVITEQSQLVFVSPSIDLTPELIKRVDLAFPKDK
jgi:Skp family chaperone for outer membrane proteins